MNEAEVRRIVREEMNDILEENNLSEDDIIVTEGDERLLTVQQHEDHEISLLQPYKMIKGIWIFLGQSGEKIIKIIGIYGLVSIGSILLFNRELPSANELALKVRSKTIEYVHGSNIPDQSTPEKYIPASSKWNSYDNQQYVTEVRGFLTGSSGPAKFFEGDEGDFALVSATGTTQEVTAAVSSSLDDFPFV